MDGGGLMGKAGFKSGFGRRAKTLRFTSINQSNKYFKA